MEVFEADDVDAGIEVHRARLEVWVILQRCGGLCAAGAEHVVLERERAGLVTYVEGYGDLWRLVAPEFVVASRFAYFGQDDTKDVGGSEAVLQDLGLESVGPDLATEFQR